ncbi:MAG: SemiSWEET transporter [Candidatus Omnitrophica bacterium]|nr:SemiSWEET transporter [Candidatus Omnitrophota bacterium]
MLWTLIGSIAATLTMFSFVPQIARSLRTKSVKDISSVTLFQMTAGVCLWTIYGIARRDPVIIIANIVSLITLLILLFLYFKYGLPTGRQGG